MRYKYKKTEHREQAIELLKGGYDLHTHTMPSAFMRSLNDFELIREADSLDMAGVMIKAHYGDTAPRAAVVNLESRCNAKAYGGLVLNQPVGGLNPYAVENSLKLGGVIIWMPTRDSKHCLEYGDMPGDFFSRPGISICDKEHKLVKEVYDIFDIVKRYGAYLATGHLSPEESVLLCKTGRAEGVNMILTHPEWKRTVIPGKIQKDLASLGVRIEKNWLNIIEEDISVSKMAANIRMVGAEHIYLATDRGQAGAEHPSEGMIRFIELLLWEGFSDKELISMVRTVPSAIAKRENCGVLL